MVKSGELNEYERNLLASMVLKVVEHCLEKYEVIKKGIQEIMGGVLLDYPAKRILNESRAEMVRNLMQSMGISLEKACEILKVNKAELEVTKGRAEGRLEGALDTE